MYQCCITRQVIDRKVIKILQGQHFLLRYLCFDVAVRQRSCSDSRCFYWNRLYAEHKSLTQQEIMYKPLLSESYFGIVVVLISACSFNILSRIVAAWLTPKGAQHSAWRWKNIFVSFVHSLISGTWALYWWENFNNITFAVYSYKYLKELKCIGCTFDCCQKFWVYRPELLRAIKHSWVSCSHYDGSPVFKKFNQLKVISSLQYFSEKVLMVAHRPPEICCFHVVFTLT